MEHFQLTINEQRSVTGIRFIAAAADKILIIVPATGVLQSFYFKLATFLQQNGITVITFDYAGIGKSLNGSIKHQTGTLKAGAAVTWRLSFTIHWQITLVRS